MTLTLAELAKELRALPRRDQAALRKAALRTFQVDAPRWIQWSIKGGGLGGAAPAKVAKSRAKPKRGRWVSKLLKRIKSVFMRRRGTRPKVQGSNRPKPAATYERRPPPAYREPVDTGDYKNSWRSEEPDKGVHIFYSAATPAEKAGVIEYGRRMAPIPIAPLAEWVRRKLGVGDPKRARSIAFAISKYASTHERAGLRVLERAHPKIAEALAKNTERELRQSVHAAVAGRALRRD